MTTLSHADIARQLVGNLPPGVFAHGARNGVIHQDFATLQRMLPGVRFASRPLGPDRWELIGICEDGSTVVWTVGGD